MKVSIITINYNNAIGLEKTIRSIVSQDLADIEYIVIDGNSSDGSKDILQGYNDKIDFWVSEPDAGIYNAMNKGIRKANGEYILFVNSGDTICNDSDMSNVIRQISGEDIIYYNLEIVDTETHERYIKEYPDQLDFKYFLEDTLPHPGSFIKKSLLVGYGYYSENMKIVSDWAFFMDSVCLDKCTYKHIDAHFSVFFLDGISSLGENRKMVFDERNQHVCAAYPLYKTLYHDWAETKQELYKLKTSFSVRIMKKLGFLKWLK